MKTISSMLILIGICSITNFTSCKKDNDLIDRNTALLIEKSWKFEIYGLDENNNGTIDSTENSMLDCETDDKFTFFPDGMGFFEGGSSPCSVDEPPVINFNWSFANNGTELAIFAAPEKINMLDENILEVYYMDVNSSGQPVKFIRRFRH